MRLETLHLFKVAGMATLDNLTLARLNACCPDLTIIQVFQFISLTIKLKDDIILVQPSSVPVSEPPEILPPTAMVFLQRSCNMTEEYVINCWNVLKLIEICTGLDNPCGLVGVGTAGIGTGCHHPTQDQPADPRVWVAGN